MRDSRAAFRWRSLRRDRCSRPPRRSGEIKAMARQANRLAGFIRDKEERITGRPRTRQCSFHLTDTLRAWMENQPFDQIMARTDVDEGELIRYFRMTIQILRNFVDTPASPEVKDRAKEAVSLLNRDIIAAERQLRR